ncbi:hypothetical protein [Caulobacter flavus]|uniref:hypothetical protein n=1 Tax=Caulobacter flavus TaxID=1679497 RepID=UPI0011AFB881|nr:hypothetical protein [Caulobacter flavus]
MSGARLLLGVALWAGFATVHPAWAQAPATTADVARSTALDAWAAGQFALSYKRATNALASYGWHLDTAYVQATSACRIPNARAVGHDLLAALLRRPANRGGPNARQRANIALEWQLCEPPITATVTAAYTRRPARWVGVTGAPYDPAPPAFTLSAEALAAQSAAEIASLSPRLVSDADLQARALAVGDTEEPFPDGVDWAIDCFSDLSPQDEARFCPAPQNVKTTLPVAN